MVSLLEFTHERSLVMIYEFIGAISHCIFMLAFLLWLGVCTALAAKDLMYDSTCSSCGSDTC